MLTQNTTAIYVTEVAFQLNKILKQEIYEL